VVGGGPIARETACLIQDFVTEKLNSMSGTTRTDLLPLAQVSIVKTEDHIHNYYDYAISKRYEKVLKIKDLNIIKDKLIEVKEKEITFQKKDGTLENIPYAACIWATGKTIQPLAQKIASKFPEQDNKLALVVEPTLKIRGTKNIYAVGDCATIDQKALFQKWETVFIEADVNKDGVIDIQEFKSLANELGKKYPALVEVKRRVEELFEIGDDNKDGKLETSEFKALVKVIDNMLTRFPSTASTAVQQGAFVGDHFNNGHHLEQNTDDVFRYKHIGGYEYVGAEEGLVERGSKGAAIITGWGAEWMWSNIYYSALVGVPMRIRITTNKLYSYVFGRDIARL